MFEQSLPNPHSKPWTFAASVTLQSAIVGTAILISLLHIDVLPMGQWKDMLVLRPPAPRAVEIVATERTSGGGSSLVLRPVPGYAVFREPSRIPNTVANVSDLDTAPQLFGSSGRGAPDISGVPSAAGGLDAINVPPPAEAKAISKESLRLGGEVLEARIIHRVVPVYPALARQMRLSGEVQLIGVIAPDGTVQKLQVISGPPILVQAAVEAVRQWIYRPTLLNGLPVEVVAPITVRFSLREP